MKPEELKAIMMAILFAGDQVATEVARTKDQANMFASTEDLKKRADRIWVEAKK